MAVEHYGRIVRTLEKNMPVKLEIDIKNTFHDDDPQSSNVVAEIPGTDKADEVVMLGAHFDSWHARHRRHRQRGRLGGHDGGDADPEGQRRAAAADRAHRSVGRRRAGPARLARLRDPALRRSRRRWRSSRNTRSSPATSTSTTAPARSAASTCRATRPCAPIFQEWMKPFQNLGVTTLTIRDTGGTDHQSFDAVACPASSSSRIRSSTAPARTTPTWTPTNGPGRRHAQNAVIVAAFVYHTANRDEKLPRKPLPKAQPAGGGRGTGAFH